MQVLTSGPLGRETRDKHTMRILTSAPPGRETNKNEPCIISLLALQKEKTHHAISHLWPSGAGNTMQ